MMAKAASKTSCERSRAEGEPRKKTFKKNDATSGGRVKGCGGRLVGLGLRGRQLQDLEDLPGAGPKAKRRLGRRLGREKSYVLYRSRGAALGLLGAFLKS